MNKIALSMPPAAYLDRDTEFVGSNQAPATEIYLLSSISANPATSRIDKDSIERAGRQNLRPNSKNGTPACYGRLPDAVVAESVRATVENRDQGFASMPMRSLTDDRLRLPAAIVALTYFWSGGRFLTILIWRANYRGLF
jgi:hypothetical protein